MTQYVFKDVVPLRGAKSLEAQKVGEIIEALEGDDKPTLLWQAARSPEHHLHGCYEWDERKAAEAHWRDTSLSIIRCVYTTSGSNKEAQPAFISISNGGARDLYRVEQIAGNLELQLQVMRSAHRELESFQKRYRQLEDICRLVAPVQEQLGAKIEQVEGRRGRGSRAAKAA